MKRILLYFLGLVVMFMPVVDLDARSVDPKGDSIAIARVRAKMDQIRKHRPTVGLVLSGGGAKGAAHVGVIKYLEELGIPVDMVVGTSMGGLVGGLYSLGYDVDQIDSLVRNMDWPWVLSDELSREYISYTDAKYKEKYLISIPFFYERDYYKMKLNDDSRFEDDAERDVLNIGADNRLGPELLKHNLLGSLPSAYVYGQNVNNLISSLTIGYQDSLAFSDLPIPFACIATDLVSGKAKVWHSGKINDALYNVHSWNVCSCPERRNGAGRWRSP